jgi:single-strand DNA-binding protein
MNQVFCAGRLGQDPELKYTPSGQPVATFSLAIDESYKKDGVKHEKVLWVRCQAWANTAETIARYLKKGDQAIISGRLQTREYEAKDGSGKRYITEVIVSRFDFGAKGRASSSAGSDEGHHDMGGNVDNEGSAPPPDGDIPF